MSPGSGDEQHNQHHRLLGRWTHHFVILGCLFYLGTCKVWFKGFSRWFNNPLELETNFHMGSTWLVISLFGQNYYIRGPNFSIPFFLKDLTWDPWGFANPGYHSDSAGVPSPGSMGSCEWTPQFFDVKIDYLTSRSWRRHRQPQEAGISEVAAHHISCSAIRHAPDMLRIGEHVHSLR